MAENRRFGLGRDRCLLPLKASPPCPLGMGVQTRWGKLTETKLEDWSNCKGTAPPAEGGSRGRIPCFRAALGSPSWHCCARCCTNTAGRDGACTIFHPPLGFWLHSSVKRSLEGRAFGGCQAEGERRRGEELGPGREVDPLTLSRGLVAVGMAGSAWRGASLQAPVGVSASHWGHLSLLGLDLLGLFILQKPAVHCPTSRPMQKTLRNWTVDIKTLSMPLSRALSRGLKTAI